MRGGRLGLRGLVVAAVLLSPLRGGLLQLAENLSIANSNLAVNALVPALVVAIAIGCWVQRRPRLEDLSRPLLVGWVLIAAVAVVNLAVQTVGLKLYAIGFAQYLIYPTLAIVVWPLIEPGDVPRLTRLLIASGLLVATTVMLQAAGVGGFIQAASSQVEGLAADRFAGITGSYLHTSAYLGTISVLMMGELLRIREWRAGVVGTLLLALIFCGEILTFSRSGIVIAAIGIAVLFALGARGRRGAFAAMVVPAIAIAILAGSVGGVAPGAAGDRITSVTSPEGDEGNSKRLESIGFGFDRFAGGSLPQKALGTGLADTGNASKLVDDHDQVVVESYYVKLLLETGVVGLLLIGGYLVWAGVAFGRLGWSRRDPLAVSVAAAGLGLSLYNLIYTVLEAQILAFVWWMLLALCLWLWAERSAPSSDAGEPEPRAESRVEVPV